MNPPPKKPTDPVTEAASPSDPALPHGPLRYRIARRDIAYLSALFESYEDLGAIRTLDPVAAIIEILYAPDLYADVLALMTALEGEMPSLERVMEA